MTITPLTEPLSDNSDWNEDQNQSSDTSCSSLYLCTPFRHLDNYTSVQLAQYKDIPFSIFLLVGSKQPYSIQIFIL